MPTLHALDPVQSELAAGMRLAKCRQCGCMQGALDSLSSALPTLSTIEAQGLAAQVTAWIGKMEPVRYACLGCTECYPALAQSALTEAFPQADLVLDLSCSFQTNADNWPPVVGEYFVLNRNAPVAVSTLGSPQLAEALAQRQPAGLAIAGKTETENIGLDKVIKNMITNPALRFLIVAGVESEGHQSGSALLALAEHGVDDNGRVLGSAAKRPVLRNVSRPEIEAFRQQIKVIDLRGCVDPDNIAARIHELAALCSCEEASQGLALSALPAAGPDTCTEVHCACHAPAPDTAPMLVAPEAGQPIVLDKAGYFVILPVTDRQVLHVEHYAYDHTLQHAVEGANARTLYMEIIQHGWLTELSHAAYLGKELATAELSLRHGFKYIQDDA